MYQFGMGDNDLYYHDHVPLFGDANVSSFWRCGCGSCYSAKTLRF
jgi:hypothetical protein